MMDNKEIIQKTQRLAVVTQGSLSNLEMVRVVSVFCDMEITDAHKVLAPLFRVFCKGDSVRHPSGATGNVATSFDYGDVTMLVVDRGGASYAVAPAIEWDFANDE